MTTTSQQDADGKAGSEPVKETPPADKEPKTVHLGEHIELRQQLRELRDKLAQMESASAPAKSKDSPAASKAPSGEEMDLRRLIEKDRIRDLTTELGLPSEKHAAAVAKVLKDAPSLTPIEALTIAAAREQDLFRASGQPAAEAQFGSLRPRPGSQPEPERKVTWNDRLKHIKELGAIDKNAQTKMWNKHVASFAAKALGWDFKLPDIPKKP